jgi:L-2-hydroxyglutarate oxidase LhgO
MPLATAKRLVYPASNPVNPFFGNHLKMTLDGHVKVVPTAVSLVGRLHFRLENT